MKTNFEYFTEKTRSGLKIYRSSDKKHLKTISSDFESIVDKFIDLISLDKIRLSDSDRMIINNFAFEKEHNKLMEHFKQHERCLFELLQDAKPISARKVIGRDSANRYELIYDKGHKICISENIFSLFPGEKLPDAYLNY